MGEFDRSSLLKFLREPRCLRDIVTHFEVPTELVDCHLQEVIKSGEVLAYRKQMPPRVLNSGAQQLRLKGLLYLSRNSPLLAKDLAASKALPKTGSSARKRSVQYNHEGSVLSSRRLRFMHSLVAHLKLDETKLSRVLNNLSSKMKLARSSKSARRPRWGKPKESFEAKSLSHAERIRLFRALSNLPLPFLDIHRRFGISKRTVMGFVKRGFFEEEWGPKNIGVKFKLTEKGEAHLRRLEEASHFEFEERKRIFIRLKQRIFS